MTDIRDKRTLITGAGGGIGLTIAKAFAAAGADLVLTDIDMDALKRAQSEIEGATRLQIVKLDVTDPEQVQKAREEVNSEGPLEILVNNAGVVFGGPFLEVPLEKHLLTYKVNTLGLVTVTHTFLPDIIRQKEGHIINIASASGMLGLPMGGTYASSKWSVIGFSESLRLELGQLGKENIKVTTVNPSYVDTGMFDGVKPPMLTPILTPEKLAAKIVEGVQEDKIFINEPFMVKTIPLLKGLFPPRVADRLADLMGVNNSMDKWKGH